MCMISNEIQQVSNTNIFVSADYSNSRQIVIYSNYVDNLTDSNAMVLPVPNPRSIKFIDLSNYKNLFEDCAKCFYNPNRSYSVSTNSFSNEKLDGKPPLRVFNVGSYKVSLALSLEQISNVDKRIFTLSPGLKETLEMFYYQPYWGFIICKLSKGPESYHPLAYSHDIIDSKLYIPTRHYHQEISWSDANSWALGLPLDPGYSPITRKDWIPDNIENSPMFKQEYLASTFNYPESEQFQEDSKKRWGSNSIGRMSSLGLNLQKLNNRNFKQEYSQKQNQFEDRTGNYKNIVDDWSHSIYVLNANPNTNNNIKQMNSCKEIWDKTSLFDPDKIPFDFGYCKNFTKIKIDGTHPNIDLVIPLSVGVAADRKSVV